MSKPLISVIIPVLNGIHFLERCHSTIQNQIYPNLEIIFVDNGSKDGSRERLIQYCTKNDNYNLLDCIQSGPAAARNKGIENASGEFISFLDVDDEIEPEKHEILLDVLNKYPKAAMAIGRTEKRFSDGRKFIFNLGPLKEGLNYPPQPGLLWLQQFQHHPHISSILIKKSILSKEPFPENLFFGEDIANSIKIGIENEVILANKIVSTYHRHEDSAVSQANKILTQTERYFQFYEKFALPYFIIKKEKVPFRDAYILSERIAYKMLIKLIKVENKKKYRFILKDMQKHSFISNSIMRSILFTTFPYNWANYFYQKLLNIKNILLITSIVFYRLPML